MLRIPSSDGITLAVHQLGPDPRGTAVLLAHATGFHGRVWEPLADQLSGCVGWAPDLRGHGRSPTPESHQFAWAGFADDVLAVVDVLQLYRPVGVGHSKGGAALLLAEARRPGTFSALWLYEPVVFPPTLAASGGAPPAEMSGRARNRRARFDSFARAEANFAAKPPLDVLDPAALHAYVRYGFAEQPDGSVTLRCRPEDEAKVYEMGSQHDAWEHLGEVRCPVTIVRGALDAPGPVLMAAPVAERLPAGHLEAHDDLGHFGPLQAPARMAASVMSTLDAAGAVARDDVDR